MLNKGTTTNNQLVLISGESTTGKTASLRNIPNQEQWLYLNSEAGKKIGFRNKFKEVRLTDPTQADTGLKYCVDNPTKYQGIIIDSITYLMDMYETQYVLKSSNTMQGWANYNQFFKTLLQTHIAALAIPVIITAHTKAVYDEKALGYRVAVPIKGALAGNGVESYFSTVISTKAMPLKDLELYNSNLLNITAEEEALGFKYVYQTKLTKATVGERIRSPIGMFTDNETFIDNDVMLLLNRLNEYYSS